MADRGLLFVFGELGPELSEEEFTSWYDEEHGPARLALPGFTNAIRYKAVDDQTPTYLTVYDLATASIAFSEPYKALHTPVPPRDREIVSRAQLLNRRVYDLLNDVTKPGATFPTQYALSVTFRVQPELDEEFNKWYDEEHVSELSKVPGFQRCRRYKLVDSVQLAKKPENEPPAHNYLAFYDVDREDWTTLPEFTAACSTPWSVKFIKGAEALEIRRFGLHHIIQPKH